MPYPEREGGRKRRAMESPTVRRTSQTGEGLLMRYLQEDLLYEVLRRGGPSALGLLQSASTALAQRCTTVEPRLFLAFLCSSFGALVSDVDECGDAGISLVKLAVPRVKLVVYVRGDASATRTWGDADGADRGAPWDGDTGSIQELFYGANTVKAGSYREAFKMCVRKQAEEAVSNAQLALIEHDRVRRSLTFSMDSIRVDYNAKVRSLSQLRSNRQARERKALVQRARDREPHAWAPWHIACAGAAAATHDQIQNARELTPNDSASAGAHARSASCVAAGAGQSPSSRKVGETLGEAAGGRGKGAARGGAEAGDLLGIEQSLAQDISVKRGLLALNRQV